MIDNQRVIYCLKFPNNKVYIGQTKNINKRIINYKYNDTKGQHKIHNAIKKYGFDCIILIILASELSKELANELEIKYIKEFNSIETGYNISSGGNHSPTEQEEVKEKLRNYNALSETKTRKSQEMKKRMQDPKFKDKALNSLHSKESQIKASKTKRERNSSCKKVECVETGKIFISSREAAIFYNGSYKHLSSHLRSVDCRKTFKGLHFKFVENNKCI